MQLEKAIHAAYLCPKACLFFPAVSIALIEATICPFMFKELSKQDVVFLP